MTKEVSMRGHVFAALLLGVACLPVLRWFVRRMDDGGDEPFGLIVLSFAGVLAWRGRGGLSAGKTARTLGAALVFASVASAPWLPPLLRALCAVPGVCLFYGVHRNCGLTGLFVLSLPVVSSLQFYLGWPLRVAAAEGCVRLLELGGLVVFRVGTRIELAGHAVNVDPACSGVRLLWHALAAACALAALHRMPWRAAVGLVALSVALVIPANVVRAALLVLGETGRWRETELSHAGVGLVSFIGVLLPLWWAASRMTRGVEKVAAVPAGVPIRKADWAMLVSAAAAVPWLVFAPQRPPSGPGPVNVPEGFCFNGEHRTLQSLPPSAEERAFAESFPGTLSSHRWGPNGQVILRRVTTATRKLHPSADCLRAAGFQTTDAKTLRMADGGVWSRFTAMREGRRLVVHERIVSESDGASWTDVTAWFWHALRRPLNGPWRAETVFLEE